MNPKQLKRVAIVLGAVVFFWVMAEILGGGRDEMETAFVLPALEMSEVDVVSIVKPGDTITLERSGDSSWTVNGYEAATDAVDDLFTALADSTEAELAATSALTHGRMGVDSSEGIFVQFSSGGEQIASVVFGKRGQAYNTRFVRLDGQDFVYQYTGQLTSLVNRNEDDWRNKLIVDIEPDSVGRVEAQRGDSRYTLTRSDDGWRLGTDEPTDSAAVRRLLGQYSSLQASGFATPEQADSADFERPDRAITLFSLGGDTLTSLVLDSTSAGYWVRQSSGAIIYRLLQWKVNQMIPADSTLQSRDEDEG